MKIRKFFTPVYKKRFFFVTAYLVGFLCLVCFLLSGIKKEIDFFKRPSTLVEKDFQSKKFLRLGGIVRRKSIRYKNGCLVSFVLEDFKNFVQVTYDGIVPSLFAEGQEALVEGHFGSERIFQGERILAKHNSRYRPATKTSAFQKKETTDDN